MTIEEMENLKLGDVVQDLELYRITNEVIFCLVAKIQDDKLYCISVDKKHESRYPHAFRFDEYDKDKLSKPIKNINELIYNKIYNNFKSLENFVKNDF